MLKAKLKKFDKELKEFFNKIDLSKHPYFTKGVFRGILICLILFGIYFYVSVGGLNALWWECEADICKNPCVPCVFNETRLYCIEETPLIKEVCGEYWDKNIILSRGEIIGAKPSFQVLYSKWLCLLILLIGLLINHLIWWYKYGRYE